MSSRNSKIDIPALVGQLRDLTSADFRDDVERKSLYIAARAATLTSEIPEDSIRRIANASVQTTVAKIAGDLGLFEIMGKQDFVFATADLANMTKSNIVLIGRILRCLASFGMIRQADRNLWYANETTKALGKPGFKAAISHSHDFLLPCWQALPGFLSKTNYQNPGDPAHTPFQKAFKTEMSALEWVLSVPKSFNDFNLQMAAFNEGKNMFLDLYPFEARLCNGAQPEDVLFVDVGGGVGGQCVAFKKRLSHVPGRVINQDLGPVISQASQCDGVEHENHDFMKDQPVKGARAYYLQNIMHKYPDDKCVLILQHIIRAMDKVSVILIDDIVLPDMCAQWRQTQLDLTMMATLAAMERTRGQWRDMLTSAGLVITQIFRYRLDLSDCIIEVVPSQRLAGKGMENEYVRTWEVNS